MILNHVLDADNRLLALVISGPRATEGISFPSKSSDPIQVGVMRWSKNHRIAPHFHVPHTREVTGSTEVLVVRRGSAEVHFYDHSRKLVTQRTIEVGDVLIVHDCGMGMVIGDDGFEAVEVRGGPYRGDGDKVRFTPAELVGQLDKA